MKNTKSYETLSKDLAKELYGKQWGLRLYNARRRAEALYKRVENAFVEPTSAPKDVVAYMTFGILSGKAKYEVTYKDLKQDSDKAITIARLTPMAEKFDNDITVTDDKGEKTTLKSVKTLLEEYKNDKISKEELLEGIEKYRNTNEYQSKAYE